MKTIYTLFFICVFAFAGMAQYSITPASKEFNSNIYTNTTYTFTFEIANTSGDTLYLGWDETHNSFLSGWDYNLCDYMACWLPPFPTNRIMDPVSDGDTAYMKLAINPMNVTGQGSIYFYLYESGSTTPGDTLKYIFNAIQPNGLQEAVEADDFVVYPNPAQNQLNVAINNTIDGTQLKLRNQLGQIVYQNTGVSTQTSSIDVSHLDAGIYFLSIEQNEAIEVKKVIIE